MSRSCNFQFSFHMLCSIQLRRRDRNQPWAGVETVAATVEGETFQATEMKRSVLVTWLLDIGILFCVHSLVCLHPIRYVLGEVPSRFLLHIHSTRSRSHNSTISALESRTQIVLFDVPQHCWHQARCSVHCKRSGAGWDLLRRSP